MKVTKRIIIGVMMTLAVLDVAAWQGNVIISTPHSQMLLTATEGSDLRQVFYGDTGATLQELRDAGSAFDFEVMPAFGSVDPVHLPALHIQHCDGDQNLELKVTDYQTQDEPR